MNKQPRQPARAVLANNVKVLMDKNPSRDSGAKVGDAAGKSQKTVWNLAKGENDPQLSSIEAVAQSFALEAFQLLVPDADKDFFYICRAYNASRGDERDLELLMLASQAILSRKGARHGDDQTSEGDDLGD